jgi:DNA-binding NtrC family response regulator
MLSKNRKPDLLETRSLKLETYFPMPKQNILVVEDEELMRSILRQLLENEGYARFHRRQRRKRARNFPGERCRRDADRYKNGGNGRTRTARPLKAIDAEALVIVMTAYSSVDSAIAALRKGAYDYVTKPFVNEDLLQTVKNAIRTKELFAENRALRRELDRHYSFSEIIGTSEKLQEVFRVVEKVADTNASVLIRANRERAKN